MAEQPPSRPTKSRSKEKLKGAAMDIGKYSRLEEIGRGSFATVYQGMHNKYRSYVAIKSVTLRRLNKKLKDNLTSEIDILKGLHHPHIVALIDCLETSSHIHLVMEFCALGDLSLFIKKRDTLGGHRLTQDMIAKYPNPSRGGLNEVVVRHFLKQLASALQFLRSRDLIHRDVKPQNLLLNPSPKSYATGMLNALPYKGSDDSFTPVVGVNSLPMLKIADFGFARSLPSTSLAETLCGSPLYMAPEILRYEKYDAKADLWSVGTVLFEMVVGKPPFKAANHVDLLRKIEQGNDKIKFPEESEASDSIKKLIRDLLKRNPVERINFREFFESSVVKGDIPGLAEEDLEPLEEPPEDGDALKDREDSQPYYDHASPDQAYQSPPSDFMEQPRAGTPLPHSAGDPPRPNPAVRRKGSRGEPDLQRAAVTGRPVASLTRPSSSGAVERRDPGSSHSSLLREQVLQQEKGGRRGNMGGGDEDTAEAERERERAAQDVAFERDYVVVEKRAVEVNAFADELAASPRLQQKYQNARNAGTIVRRATTTATGTTPSQAQAGNQMMAPASQEGRLGIAHRRQSSNDAKPGPSATSAISKALNMASGRLFGVNFSPPIALTRGGRSPPMGYNPFPQYPLQNAGLLPSAGDGSRTPRSVPDEDTKTVQLLEEGATRSDVVYGFAEVKYKQLVPLTPSSQPGNTIGPGGMPATDGDDADEQEDEGLTDDAVVTLCEESLLLYVKALSLLANAMDVAGAWWVRKNRGEVIGDSPPSRTDGPSSAIIANRINSVVQWIRNRFNEMLPKAEFSRLRLIEVQRRLYPDKQPADPQPQSSGAGSAIDQVYVGSGTTAERLMYDRALEMSRAAAINELTGDDLPGCDIAYVTAIRMLEAVLDNEEEKPSEQKEKTGSAAETEEQNTVINGLEAEDRKVVEKLIESIRARLNALRKKTELVTKRTSAPPAAASPSGKSGTPQPQSSSPATPR